MRMRLTLVITLLLESTRGLLGPLIQQRRHSRLYSDDVFDVEDVSPSDMDSVIEEEKTDEGASAEIKFKFLSSAT